MVTQGEVYSVWRCDICKPVKTIKKQEAKERGIVDSKDENCVYTNVNPTICPYSYVKIEGKYYERQVETRDNCEFFDNLPENCHDCGIKLGQVHHVGCDVERCPICDKQLILVCDCVWEKPAKFYKELPATVTSMKVQRKVLRKYIQN
jgi:hypothetical protein